MGALLVVLLSVVPLYISELGTQDTPYVFWYQLLSYTLTQR